MANQQLISLYGQQFGDIFPAPATQQEMLSWFNNTIPQNPFNSVAPGTANYTFNNGQMYTAAINGPFAVVWNDTLETTTIRERLQFLVHLGDVADYNEQQNRRGVSATTATGAMQNGVPVPAHWTYNIGNSSGTKPPDLTKTWQQHVGAFVKKVCSDSRGGMVDTAKVAWNKINPSPDDPWHAHVQVPGRIVKIFRYYLGNVRIWEAERVKWLLGARLRSHFDTSALFTGLVNNIPHLVPDPNSFQQVDLVPVLVEWLEFVLAHVLTECFKSYYLVPNSRASRQMLAANLEEVARQYPHRALLQANVAEFPYI